MGEAPGRRVRLLTERSRYWSSALRGFDEAFGLHEHARRAAARVVHAPLVRFEHLHQQSDDAAGCKELAAALALRLGKLTQEVLVNTSRAYRVPWRSSSLKPMPANRSIRPFIFSGRCPCGHNRAGASLSGSGCRARRRGLRRR